MRNIFIANFSKMKEFKNVILNENGYTFSVEDNNIIVGIMNCGKIKPLIHIFIDEIDNIVDIGMVEKYSIINELLLPFSFQLRYSKKEL